MTRYFHSTQISGPDWPLAPPIVSTRGTLADLVAAGTLETPHWLVELEERGCAVYR